MCGRGNVRSVSAQSVRPSLTMPGLCCGPPDRQEVHKQQSDKMRGHAQLRSLVMPCTNTHVRLSPCAAAALPEAAAPPAPLYFQAHEGHRTPTPNPHAAAATPGAAAASAPGQPPRAWQLGWCRWSSACVSIIKWWWWWWWWWRWWGVMVVAKSGGGGGGTQSRGLCPQQHGLPLTRLPAMSPR